jgi:hypothetical protein
VSAQAKTFDFEMALRLQSQLVAEVDEAAHELRTTRSNFICQSILRNLEYFSAVELPSLREQRAALSLQHLCATTADKG